MDNTDEKQAAQQGPAPKLVVIDRHGGIDHVYANNVAFSVTLMDVTLWFGQLSRIPNYTTSEGTPVNQLEQRATVTLAWYEAKVLSDMLADWLLRYEKANGQIKTPLLPVPESPKSPKS